MSDAVCHVRLAEAGDAEAVAELAAGLAQSFPFSRARFGLSYPALLAEATAGSAVDERSLRDLGLNPAASKMPLWSAMPTRGASSPW